MLETLRGRYTIKQILEDEHRHWKRFEEKYRSSLRPAIIESVAKVLACRDPERMGYHRYRCLTPGCFSERIVPHSSKSRFCSSCWKVMTDRWMEKTSVELLDSLPPPRLYHTTGAPECLCVEASPARHTLLCRENERARMVSKRNGVHTGDRHGRAHVRF